MWEVIAIGSVPVIIAIVELVKRTARPSKRWLPLIAVAVGILTNALASQIAADPLATSAAAGLIAGLAAAGLYDGRKVIGRKGKAPHG